MHIIFNKNSMLHDVNDKMFTGVGSRLTPEILKYFIASISYVLGMKGYGLRSGRAKRADHYFEIGVPPHMFNKSEIYLPQRNFGTATKCRSILVSDSKALMEAMYIIDKNHIHENWFNLINQKGGQFAVAAHTRNVFQCLGLTPHYDAPSDFLICWTPCGSKTFDETSSITGGTRTAIRLASIKKIPVFNLATREDATRLYLMVENARKTINIPFNLPSFKEIEDHFKC